MLTLSKRLFLSVLLAISLSVQAQNTDYERRLNADSAARIIQQQTNGRVLSVTSKQNNGYNWFFVKVLHNDGRIKVYKVDGGPIGPNKR